MESDEEKDSLVYEQVLDLLASEGEAPVPAGIVRSF